MPASMLEIEKNQAILRMAKSLEKLANLKKHEMWLMYHIHVDSLESRPPSKFLSEGFANIMATK